MNVVAFDLETESHNKGSWNDPRNYVITICWSVNGEEPKLVFCNPSNVEVFQKVVDSADLLVGFNVKFDLHWLRRCGVDYSAVPVCDLQILEFILNGQSTPYPALNDLAAKYLGRLKLDKIKTDYWEQGKLTSEVPRELLTEYAIEDVRITWDLYEKMKVPEEKQALFNLINEDLLVLEEVETNGLRYDRQKSLALADELEREVNDLYQRNFSAHNLPDFNWGSPQQLRALLFGGTLVQTKKVPNGVWKSGEKKGLVKYRTEKIDVHFPRRFEPVDKTSTGDWSTDDDALSKLPKGDSLLEDLRRIRKLRKEIDTYLRGLPNKQDIGNYGHSFIYSQFNLCVADTGRLSSSGPNFQNLSDTALSCCVSRYA